MFHSKGSPQSRETLWTQVEEEGWAVLLFSYTDNTIQSNDSRLTVLNFVETFVDLKGKHSPNNKGAFKKAKFKDRYFAANLIKNCQKIEKLYAFERVNYSLIEAAIFVSFYSYD